jgi:cell division protein FtsB
MQETQLTRLQRDSAELKHYIHKLHKRGKADLAYKVEKKRNFLNAYISDLEQETQSNV